VTPSEKLFDEFIRGLADVKLTQEEHEEIIQLMSELRSHLGYAEVENMIYGLERKRVEQGLTPYWW
jgi:hypothetical protein